MLSIERSLDTAPGQEPLDDRVDDDFLTLNQDQKVLAVVRQARYAAMS
ncbi:hypothetical protein I6A84_27865 [Frankia sp. CNm7]|uniref:Uncharacterized protein n=1 Tax=Frankia nepalensis TaxID=1836974 RepID=A0A937URM1_9ACTN|nr:hypothetical protein [Frankia nepalensis]MBL7499374.1 hypothetical protein [Frankia nepalensis]MBL7512811.1 hypothetical protein [Frankia nepalensis]MBL7521795.1 hypothetical protein [Frankia nepalensis]MBL7631517.1 hypothetical protein [Frankia nepalensis]